ncbi:MAG: hypothetical protein ACLUKN_10085 [Bacilli bacterium]
MGKWGADVVRLWISSVDYQNDMPISDGIMSHVANAYRSFRNTVMYQLETFLTSTRKGCG